MSKSADAKDSSVSNIPWKKYIDDGDVEAIKNWLASEAISAKEPATGETPVIYVAKLLKRPEIVAKLGKQSLDAQRLEIFRLLLEHGASPAGLLSQLAHNDRDDAAKILLTSYPVSKREIKDAMEIGDLSDAGNVCDLLEAHIKTHKS